MLPPLICFQLIRANRDDIISPASGIHRPSYNGAPAKQTCLAMSCLGMPGDESRNVR